jgi:hypothetical protein
VTSLKARQPTIRERRGWTQVLEMRVGKKRTQPFIAAPLHARCTLGHNKLRYSSQAASEEALRQQALYGSAKQVAFRVYQCDECGGWHLSSQPRRSARYAIGSPATR